MSLDGFSIVAVGTAISFIFWGGAMASLILANRSVSSSSNASRRMRTFLLCYVWGMFALSTAAVLSNFISFLEEMDQGAYAAFVYSGFSGIRNLTGLIGASCLLLVILL